jgi:hypothetical protein
VSEMCDTDCTYHAFLPTHQSYPYAEYFTDAGSGGSKFERRIFGIEGYGQCAAIDDLNCLGPPFCCGNRWKFSRFLVLENWQQRFLNRQTNVDHRATSIRHGRKGRDHEYSDLLVFTGELVPPVHPGRLG